MKRIITIVLMAVVGITGPFVSHLGAQDYRMAADIPFAFVVGNQTMPAGHYDLSRLSAGGSVFALRDTLNNNAIFAQLAVLEEGKPNKPSVTFACYGKECLLAKITPPNSVTSYSLGNSSIEKKLHHTLGMSSMVSVKLAGR